MQAFDLTPGPIIGRLLGMVREAQAAGKVHTPDEALDFIRKRWERLCRWA